MRISNKIIFLGVLLSAFSSSALAASLSYGPKSCGHALQGMDVYLTNSADSAKKYTVNILMKPANNDWSNKNMVFSLMPNEKRRVGCTKGNTFPPLGMEYKILSVEEL